MNTGTSFAATLGRILMSSLFLMSGFGKLVDPVGTKAYIASRALPWPDGAFVVAVIIEIGFGTALALGYRTRIVALVMAVFTLATALTFHDNYADPKQLISFMKNIAIIGGFLQVMVLGAGSASLDAWLAARKQRVPARV
ncbi:putative oxidoreductase [Paraburkholderia sp. BL23I1N1]|uniref:DoxX family protein n=1 Tax=Paraburkholderia sp. BL23I1N1 TaxID=1938802 RepID=UPI000E73EFCF|nr:DoxX family protein [Paraburkholderia sp. BL23I1N1]RKE36357.1 putative oxidoreductase [Paraburkholderia sp. BL23I1N1]